MSLDDAKTYHKMICRRMEEYGILLRVDEDHVKMNPQFGCILFSALMESFCAETIFRQIGNYCDGISRKEQLLIMREIIGYVWCGDARTGDVLLRTCLNEHLFKMDYSSLIRELESLKAWQ